METWRGIYKKNRKYIGKRGEKREWGGDIQSRGREKRVRNEGEGREKVSGSKNNIYLDTLY